MLIGKRLYGRYKIDRMIGGGGMANVYLAQDMILEREVAVKILRMDFNNDEEFIKRFNREAQSATSLYHPNIVSIYDVGEEDDIYFIVMEYVKGLTLKQYIQHHQKIPVEKTLYIMQQITAAISHAHQHGIIHRDIKPQNILIDDDDHVKITDFGIATALSATSITQTNAVLGSVHYLSPEQARGGMANKKSDIYSLGIVMFELLTGRLPFSGESAVSIALKHLQSSTPLPKRWNPSIPQSVENIVLKAMAKDSFHRYENVEEMKEDIMTALQPNRLHEKPFVIPEDMDATKAIPIITQDTVIPATDETIIVKNETQIYPDEEDDEDDTQTHQPDVIVQKQQIKNTKVKKTKPKTKTKKVKVKKSKGNVLKGILLTLFIVVLLGLLAFLFVPKLLEPAEVEVPNVEGESLTDATAMLLEKNFTIGKHHPINDAEIEEGKVIKTNPPAGKTVKEGKEIEIYYSKGKKSTKMISLTNSDLEDAIETLNSLDMKYTTKKVYDDQAPAHTVISQFPTVDTEIIPSETVVELTVSLGPKLIQLRDLSEYSENSLAGYEEDTGLKIIKKSEEYHDTIPIGQVIRQYPRPYTNLTKGSRVEVVISKGKKEQPPKEVTRDITVSYEPDPLQPDKAQDIVIFIQDMTRDLNEASESFQITKSEKRSIRMMIEAGGKARYRIMRDGQIIEDETIDYPTS